MANSMARYFPSTLPGDEQLDGNESRSRATNSPDDDEADVDDFMSDKFLVAASEVDSRTSKTYSDKRRAAIRRSEALGRVASRAEREKEARERGLKTSLLQPSTSTAISTESKSANIPVAGNKALEMMMKMGFTPGEALGKRNPPSASTSTPPCPAHVAKQQARAESTNDDESDSDNDGFISLAACSGLGSKKRKSRQDITITGMASSESASASASPAPEASTSRRADDKRVDPLEIRMRSGRAGFGVDEAKRRRLAEHVENANARAGESVTDYRARVQSHHAERRAEGKLREARKTCMLLDEAASVRDNHLWLDPLEEEHKRREALLKGRWGNTQARGDFGADEIDESGIWGDDQSRERFRNTTGDELDDGKMDAHVGEEILDDAELDKREERRMQFLSADAVTRLKETVAYMRDKHFYCLWCGAQYADAEELNRECPGENEDDH